MCKVYHSSEYLNITKRGAKQSGAGNRSLELAGGLCAGALFQPVTPTVRLGVRFIHVFFNLVSK